MSIYPPPVRSAFSASAKARIRIIAAGATAVGLIALLVAVTGFPVNRLTASNAPSVTATPTATRTPLVSIETHLTAISMVSSSEGWAVGYDGDGKRARLLHFHSGTWSLADNPNVTILPRAITMLSATDGWIGGAASNDGDNAAGVMLHYSGDQWLPFPLPAGTGAINSITMVGANEGWAVDDTPDDGHAHILHYVGGVWTIAKTMADRSLLQSVSMVNANEGWIAGRGSYNPGLNGTPGALWHYLNGTWQRVTPSDPTHADVDSVAMLPTGEGWGTGSYQVSPAAPGQDVIPQAAVVWHYSGGRWQIAARFRDASGTARVTALFVSDASGLWFAESGTSGNYIYHPAHPSGFSWSGEGTRNMVLTALAMDSPDDGWAVSESAQLVHYFHGGWMPYTPR